MENKKIKKVIIGICIIAIIIFLYIFFQYRKLFINKDVTINSDETYIASILYDYEMEIDAGREYYVFIYKDSNDYKYEIKYGEITIAGQTEMITKGYGRLTSIKDIEDMNNSFEKEKRKDEEFFIKYCILNEENSYKYCDLDEFKDFLFEKNHN